MRKQRSHRTGVCREGNALQGVTRGEHYLLLLRQCQAIRSYAQRASGVTRPINAKQARRVT